MAALAQILGSHFVVGGEHDHDNLERKGRLSFEASAIPLCVLLSKKDIVNSPHYVERRKVYAKVWEMKDRFLNSTIECLTKSEQGAFLRYSSEVQNKWLPVTFMDMLEPVLELFDVLRTTMQDVSVDPEFAKYVSLLRGCFEKVPAAEVCSSETSHAGRKLKRLEQVVQDNLSAEERKRRAEERREITRAEQQLLKEEFRFLGFDVEIPPDDGDGPGPGDLNPKGPRHDNDFEDYRKIVVFPTQGELLSEEIPYLPRNSAVADYADHHIEDPVARHLDIQFRLTREELCASYRRGIQWFVSTNALGTLKDDAYRVRSTPTIGKEGSNRSNSVSMLVMRDVSIHNLLPSLWEGVSVEISFRELSVLEKKSKQDVMKYWEQGPGSRVFQKHSLVCLMLGASKRSGGETERMPFKLLVSGSVVQPIVKDDYKANRHRMRIRLRRPEDITALVRWIGRKEKVEQSENVLIQVRGGEFVVSLDAVCQTLQIKDDLPFARLLTSPRETEVLSPTYAKGGFNFSCIFKDKKNVIGGRTFPVTDYADLREFLWDHEKDLILDHTQCAALAAALTREVSLIQGPPGTGKSYVGVHIVRVLLENSAGNVHDDNTQNVKEMNARAQNESLNVAARPFLDPICCICYTNHALDQFLESLLDNGVPVDQICRIGGKCKSERLQEALYYNLPRKTKETPAEYTKRRKINVDADSLEQTIEWKSKKLENPVRKTQDLSDFVDQFYPTMFEGITESRDLDGFEEVVAEKDAFVRWLTRDGWKKYKDEASDEFGFGNGEESMKMEDLEGVDPWSIPEESRLSIWRSWVNECDQLNRNELQEAIMSYEEIRRDHQALDLVGKLRGLRTCKRRIVGLTTSGCALHADLVRALAPRIVICEEASEVLESHILSALAPTTEQLILIGDHLQLAPKVSEYSLTMKPYLLDLSLFERLVKAFEDKEVNVREDERQVVTLLTQYRMSPELSQLLKRTLYPKLVDSNTMRPTQLGFRERLWFFTHDNREEREKEEMTGQSKSYVNRFEVDFVTELIPYIVRQGYPASEIAVLTPYVGQLLALRERLRSRKIKVVLGEADLMEIEDSLSDDGETVETPGPRELLECVRLSTVDNFQGEEARIVILSTVRNNRQCRTGFLKIQNRVNVMISRAKDAMIVIGSKQTVRGCRTAVNFNKILDVVEEQELIGNYVPLKCQKHGKMSLVRTADDLRLHADGGCLEPCGARLECGHARKKFCHVNDLNHTLSTCSEKCKVLLSCGHACPELCHLNGGHKCGKDVNCKIKVTHTFPCQHVGEVECHLLQNSEAKCSHKVETTLPWCGHTIEILCFEKGDLERYLAEGGAKPPNCLFKCRKPCNWEFKECGHACDSFCGECLKQRLGGHQFSVDDAFADRHSSGQCRRQCGRDLLCGHVCKGVCHRQSECPPCTEACTCACVHSKCPKKCKDQCPICCEECDWRCDPMNHKNVNSKVQNCLMSCEIPCDRLPCDERCKKKLQCGHQCQGLCGEECDEKLCHICALEVEKDWIVDFVELTKLREYDPEKNGPLILLKCGHRLTVDYLDGQLNLELFYTREENQWSGLRELSTISDETLRKDIIWKCPACNQLINGVRRYGRILKLRETRNAQLKFMKGLYVEKNQLQKQFSLAMERNPWPVLAKAQRKLYAMEKKLNDTPFHRALVLEKTNAGHSATPSFVVEESQAQSLVLLLWMRLRGSQLGAVARHGASRSGNEIVEVQTQEKKRNGKGKERARRNGKGKEKEKVEDPSSKVGDEDKKHTIGKAREDGLRLYLGEAMASFKKLENVCEIGKLQGTLLEGEFQPGLIARKPPGELQ